MNDIFTKREIAVILFIIAGLAGGYAVERYSAPKGVEFSALQMTEEPAAEAVEPPPKDIAKKAGFSSENKAAPKIISRQIDINHASLEELLGLRGIGPALAGRIIEDRAQNGLYIKPEDLLRVKGIGPATLAKFKEQIIIKQ